MKTVTLLLLILISSVITAQETNTMKKKVSKTEQEWKEILSPQQYYVLREKGTDRPGDDGYTKHFEKGTYHCAACDAQLFESGTKYESHCGWPSFDDAIKGSVEYVSDHQNKISLIDHSIPTSQDLHLMFYRIIFPYYR